MTTHRRATFGVFAGLAVAAAAIVWFGMPHDREVTSLWVFLVKLLPFAFAVEAIAWLDPAWFKSPLVKMLAMVVTFAAYFLYFVPKIFFNSDDFPTLYYLILTLTPMIILSLVLAFRLGGGAAGHARRAAYAMLLVMLSGSEDLAFLTINHQTDPRYTPIPAVWTWASHMTVFLGHPPTKYQAYAFIAVHLCLAALVLTVPARWFRRGAIAGAPAASSGTQAASSGMQAASPGTPPSPGTQPASPSMPAAAPDAPAAPAHEPEGVSAP